MIPTTRTASRLLVALSFMTFPLGAIAATNTLSFTAHSLNLNPGDWVRSVAVDAQGDAYQVVNVTDSSGASRAQITETNPAGQVIGSYRFGSRQTVYAIQGDRQSVIVVGQGYAADFPTAFSYGPATMYLVAFVARLDSGLAGITAAAVIGGSNAISGTTPSAAAGSVNVDAAGDIYIGGGTTSQDFPVTAGAYDKGGAGATAVLVEFSPGLDMIVFSTYSPVYLGWLQVDATGAIAGVGTIGPYVVVPATPSPTLEYATATKVIKFASGGGSVLWTATLAPPSQGSQTPEGLAFFSDGNVVVVGGSDGGAKPPPSALQSCGGGFVAKLSGSSGAIQFLTSFGCAGVPGIAPSVNSVAIDASGTIWITGVANPSSLPVTPNSYGSGSTYLAALAPDGSSVEALYMGPAGLFGLFGQGLVLTSAGNPVTLGSAGFLTLSNTAGGPSLLGGVANSAGSAASGLIAPAELLSFYGSGLGPATPLDAQIVNGVVQSKLGGYQLLFGGFAAPLLYIGENQINAIVPNEVFGQDQESVSVALVTPTGSFPVADLYIRPSRPEIFHDPVSGYAVAINQDGTLNSSTNPARPGWIVSIWGTGAGESEYAAPPDGTIEPAELSLLHFPALPVAIIANYDSLEVDYAGDSPDEVFGLLQVNFRLQQSLPAYNSSLAVSLQVGAAIGAPVSIYVKP